MLLRRLGGATGHAALRIAVATALAIGLGFGVYVLAQDHPTDRPCPSGSRSVHPTVTHLSPTVIEHQNWVGLPPTEVQSGQVLYICTDGRAIGRAVMDDGDVASSLVVLDIPTRWVDATWLSGSLDAYRQPDRWQVVFPPFDASSEAGASAQTQPDGRSTET